MEIKSSKKVLSEYQKAHKRAEHERARLQKEHQKELERKAKLEAKELKLREKQAHKDEEEKLKEERRLKRLEEQRKREEEKEAERKKKEEEKLRREEELRRREEEKEVERKRKEDERRRKEDERIQKEEEKKREEEDKTKREQKQRAVLMDFLLKSDQKKECPPLAPTTISGPFMLFELRKDMRMAPIHRVSSTILSAKRANLDKILRSWAAPHAQDSTATTLGLTKFGRPNYLYELRTKQHHSLSYPSTYRADPPDVQIVEDPAISLKLKQHGYRGTGGTVCLKAKLLQFVENYRPAYYGTWRRRSRIITGRNPWAKDEEQLDYLVDSDDEWEEEEPGESITQSDNEEEEEKEEEDEEEDEQFFVPHGYLSDDEGVAADGEDGDEASGEMKKLRRRLSVVEYEVAHRRGLQRLEPLLLGPIWLSDPVELTQPSITDNVDEDKENVEGSESTSNPLEKRLSIQMTKSALCIYRVHLWDDVPPITFPVDKPRTPANRRNKKELPEDALPYLIHLAHMCPLARSKIAFEFRVFWHRHTTGQIPDCTQYAVFKQYCVAMTNPTSIQRQTSGPIWSGPVWDNLAFSQTLVGAKLSEIAVFEDGRWKVDPKVLRQFRNRLQTLVGCDELADIPPDADDMALSSVNFPPWSYLTDVNAITKRSSRASASKRRSLENPTLCNNESAAVTTEVPAATLLPVIQPLVLDDSPRSPIVCRSLLDASQVKLRESPRVLTPKDTNSCTNTDVGSAVKSHDSSTGTSGKKRVTLENFFTPPRAKRPHQESRPAIDVVMVDSD